MELERPMFPLLNEALNYLDVGVVGKIINIVMSKNKFVFHMNLEKCEKINNDEIDLDLIKEEVMLLSDVQPGSLLGCLHPQSKKWRRCYVVSIAHQQANVALCDTGEMTMTKKLKVIPDRYKNIPAITFQCEIRCICLFGKLRHLMENFEDYIATFDSFNYENNVDSHKKMMLFHKNIKNSCIDFIIRKWDPLNQININDGNYNSMMFENGSVVVIAKVENYDWRHIFVRSVDNSVNVCKKLQIFCENVSNIERNVYVGDIVAVKCVDKFYRAKIINMLDNKCYSLYLLDSGYVIAASVDCIVDLSDMLKKIPPTVSLIGLKDIDLKPWTLEASLYINNLFENSTAMILEYPDNDSFGLDSVTLTIINNNEDVNKCLKTFLEAVENPQIDTYKIKPVVHEFNEFKDLYSDKIIPIKVKNLQKSDSKMMTIQSKSGLQPGDGVYITAFYDLNEIYIRKLDDHTSELDEFLDEVHKYCSLAESVDRDLEIGDIVGAKSPLDDSFYRGKILKKIDDGNYLVQFIDFGDKENVPKLNIFDIPEQFLRIPSSVIPITLKGVKSCPLNTETLNYITTILSNYEKMTIDFSLLHPFENVTLTTMGSHESVNERINELLNNEGCTLSNEVIHQFVSENIESQDKICNDKKLSKLKRGDVVFITTFVDVHNIFVRKVEDNDDDFLNFIEEVNSFCSSETPIGKLLKLNDVIGAKSIADRCFYRAKVIKKVNDVSYDVIFIDYGNKENVHLAEIVSLSSELKQVIPTINLVKLKGVEFSLMNSSAREYVNYISENESLTVDFIDDNTNEVILKTGKNENVNDYLNKLIHGDKIINDIYSKETEELLLDFKLSPQQECKSVSLQPGAIVYMTAFITPNEIYIRKVDDYNDEFHNLLDQVDNYCKSTIPINRLPIIDEIVGARSSLDNSFYRGKVLNKIDDSTYLIQYIDFGDKENVPISNIFEIPKEFVIPSNLVVVSLKGINSCVLNVEASNYISNLLSNYMEMTIDFDSKIPLKDVTLITINSNENLTEILNKLMKDTNNSISNNVENYVAGKEIVQDVVKNLPAYNEINPFKNGDNVYITAYVDPHCIYIRKIDDNNDEFQKLIERVNSFCSLGNSTETKPPELNQIVGAKSSFDELFYRARVVKKIDENNYNTLFIDFGFEESVNVTDIVPLPKQLEQVVPSIHLVGLKNVCFENLNQDGHTYLENLMFHSELIRIENVDNLSAVTLTVINQEQNIVDYLNNLHLDETMANNTIIDNSVSISPRMKYLSYERIIPQIPPLTNKSTVTIHAFISLKDIYISVPFNKSEFELFLKNLSAHCLNSKPITKNPNVGEVFCIRSPNDGSFNRGLVEEKINENEYKVIFVDSGIKDIVPVSNFIEIPKNLKQVPRTIYSIVLKDLNFETLNAQAMSYVNMLCENMPLIIEFDENDPNGLNTVTLTTVNTKQNVNNELIKLLTEKERDSPETVQTLSKGDIVYISSFVDFQTVYVRRINNGTDKFKSFLENFSSYCALERPIEKVPEVGEIVAAKEKNGSKFYRAEIIVNKDDKNFDVCFIDFGSRDTVHISNIVKPPKLLLQNCPPTFMVGLDGLNSDPVHNNVMQYINNISESEILLIDSIKDQNKVILVSVNTQCCINNEIKKLVLNCAEPKALNLNKINTNCKKCVIKYFKPALNTPTQVWIAEKFSSSRYSVHTYESRNEFMRLEKLMFKDSKTFETVKFAKIHMPCIVYMSPTWYRGEVLEVIDDDNAKVGLVDVGNFSVIRNIKEMFSMPPEYKGKSLLMNIEIQPEPQEKLSVTTLKVIAKKYLDNSVVVEIMESSVDQSYSDLICNDSMVGLPSFSSTPIPEDSNQFRFNNSLDESTMVHITNHFETKNSPSYLARKNYHNNFTIQDLQHARWQKGSLKTLTFLCLSKDYLVMRDHLIDDTLTDLEFKIQDYCSKITEPYSPVENELCLAKYCDNLWYRAMCVKTANSCNENYCEVYFIDWGVQYSVSIGNIHKISKEFIYLPASAFKCYIQDVTASEWSDSISDILSQHIFSQFNCQVVEKLSSDCYTISCDIIKNLIVSNQ